MTSPWKCWRLIIAMFLLIPLQSLYAQKKWSLQDCINHALNNNIQIRQQRLNLDLASDNLLQSRLALFPSVNGNASHAYNYGRTVDRFTNNFATTEVQSNNFYIQGQLTVFNGFQMLHTIARNRLNLMAGKYDVEKMQNDISLNLASAYLNILYNQEAVSNASGQYDLTVEQVTRIRKLVEAGSLAKSNLLNIEAQAATEELSLVNARNNLEIAYLTLVQILDMKTTEGFDIARPALNVPDQLQLIEQPAQIFAIAQGIQPEVKSAELKVESALRDLYIARGSTSPVLTLAGSYGTGYSGASQRLKGYSIGGLDTIGYTAATPAIPVVAPSLITEFEKIPFHDQINDNLNKSFGFYLSIPIFNAFQSRTAISRAKIGIAQASYSLDITRNQLYQDVQRAWADAQASVKQYHAAKKSLDAMHEAYFYTQQRFEIGSANSVEFSEAKKNLAKAESDVLTAKYEYVFRKTVLDFYMGKPINLE